MFEKSILVTGGAGFIGTNFVAYFARTYPNYRLIDLDALTYAGSRCAFDAQKQLPTVVPVEGDIRNAELVRELLEKYDITGVIHFAAESHVDNSIVDPLLFVDTNVNGTVALLNESLRYWKRRGCLAQARFHHISTDEVYGSLGEEGFFTEKTPYAPNGPYSASKAASDLLVRAYCRTYGLNATISNCSNNYGPYQFPEKLIPLMINNVKHHKQLPVYGDGMQIRDWLYVEDHCKAIDMVANGGKIGEVYNVGGHNERPNIFIVKTIIAQLHDRLQDEGISEDLIKHVADRLGHDRRYGIDPTKIKNDLGWYPETPFEKGIVLTIDWYLNHEEWMNHVISGDYQRYFEYDGVRYAHLIDLTPGYPARYVSSVAVLARADTGGLADALSTGLFCLPEETGQALAAQNHYAVLWMHPDETTSRSADWPQ